MSNELNFRDVYHAVHGTLCDVDVLLARPARDAQPTVISVQTLRTAIGDDSYRESDAWIRPHVFTAPVKDGDVEREMKLVELRQFIMFCSQSPLPKFKSYRDGLLRIIDDVQEVGGYINETTSIATILKKEYGSNPLIMMTAELLDTQRIQEKLAKEQAALKANVEQLARDSGIQKAQITALQKNESEESHWLVSVWLEYHGHPFVEDISNREGKIVAALCRQMGVALGEKVNRGKYLVNKYPFRVLKVWWPDCCKRHGWPLSWKVTH